MGNARTVEVQDSKGKLLTKETTNLEWALQFVKLKVQEMVCPISFSSVAYLILLDRYSMVERQINVE